MIDQEKIRLFQIWYVEPINLLETLPNGDGGWVVFIVGLALYERLINAQLKTNNQATDDVNKHKAICDDLGITEHQRSVFWSMCRNGLLHQAMPKIGSTSLWLRDEFSDKPEFQKIEGIEFICINPWKFTKRVLNDFLSAPELIDASDSNPLAIII